MKAFLTIVDDNGKQLLDYEFDPAHPKLFRTQAREEIQMNEYDWFGFVYQPHVMIRRQTGGYIPTGAVPTEGPSPSPVNGPISGSTAGMRTPPVVYPSFSR